MTAHSSGESPAITIWGRTMETILVPTELVLGAVAAVAYFIVNPRLLRVIEIVGYPVLKPCVWLAGIAVTVLIATTIAGYMLLGVSVWTVPGPLPPLSWG